jgi:GGDEF domain-containing protein
MPEVELLARWSLGVQLGAVALLAAFFVALTRTIRLQEVRLWAAAWIADAAALAAAFLGTALANPPVVRLAIIAYVALKTAYVLLLVTGARNHLRPGAAWRLPWPWVAAAVGAWSVALGLLAPTRDSLHLGVSLVAGVFLTAGGVWVLRRPRGRRSRWLGFALLAEGLLYLYYVPVLLPTLWGGLPIARRAPYASFLDAGAELLMALAILVVIEGSSSQHLEHLNRELLASQERLRQLVDLDPLTALANRRRLRDEMERVRANGAAVIFLDVDNFKEINDRFGHIVIAPGLDPEAAGARVATLRADLAEGGESAPPCHISVGVASLAPRGEPDVALREADDRMYLEKRRRKVPDRPRNSATRSAAG